MRKTAWAVVAAAVGALVTGAPSATALDAEAVAWSVGHQTAAASGERWTEPSSTGLNVDLVISGKLSSTGEGCYSLWTRFLFDLGPGKVLKQAEICGSGTVDIDVRQAYRATTTGSVTVCKGTVDTTDCASWENITWWPIDTSNGADKMTA
ncbi:hypothetical protein ACF08M_29805 [Streptomyces sp. NPDC015032]|uniref:hypothetical protein n=1 Tax=Streptomyces sp. NPDC015032 TaxID=3364937 RepID=UPI0036F787C6